MLNLFSSAINQMAPKKRVVSKQRDSSSSTAQPIVAPALALAHAPTLAAALAPPNSFGISFWDVDKERNYNITVERNIINTSYFDRQALQALRLFDEIIWMFRNIGWQCFLEMMHPTYIPLTLEFFSSLEVKVSLYIDNDPS